MAINVVFTGIAVENYPAACRWYERLLGRPPDMLPKEIEAAWQLSDTAWMYVITPIIVGGGKPALPPNVQLALELVEEHRFGNGMVFLRYRAR